MKSKNLIILEEVFSGVTHGIAFIAVLIVILLLFITPIRFKSDQLFSLIIFITCLGILYLFSTLYHSLFFTKANTLFSILDKSGIYLLIAGTYTAFIIITINNWIGYSVLALIWTITILGIVYTALRKINLVLNTIIYLIMGWTALIFIQPLLIQPSHISFELIVLGGLLYSVGVVVFFFKKVPFAHVVWHLFVIGGSLCHFLAIYLLLT